MKLSTKSYLSVLFMMAAVLSAAGVLCGKKQNVARWLKISAKWCCFGLAGPVESSCENVMTMTFWHFCVLPD
jgi:hypothetical protein